MEACPGATGRRRTFRAVLPTGIELNSGLSVGELIVGLGTLSLAGFTGWLGFETRASAKAAREAVEASNEPFVVATPTPPDLSVLRPGERIRDLPIAIHRAPPYGANGSFVRMRLWNIGDGPAIVRHVSISRDDATYIDGVDRFYPLGAGQVVDIEVSSRSWPSTPCVAVLTIQYFRASGLTYLTESDLSIDGRIATCLTYRRSRPELDQR